MNKIMTSTLAAMLLISSVVGCSSGTTTTTTTNSEKGAGEATESKTAKTTEVNAYGWPVPEETLEINIFAGQGSPDEMTKYGTKINEFLKEKFNVVVNKIVYDTDRLERMNLMLASNDYPEAVMGLSATDVQQWKDLGKVVELTELVKEQPNLMQKFGPYMPLFEDEEGKLWNLATGYSGINRDNTIPCVDNAPMVREDWYKEIGSPDISTPQGYFDAIKMMVEKHPTTENGNKVYGLATYKTNPALSQMLNTHMGGMFGLKSGFEISEDGEFKHWVNSEIGLETVKYINQFAREGLLDPDSLTMTVEEWGQKGTDQRYAAYLGPWWQPGYYISDNWMKQMESKQAGSYPEEMRYVHYLVKDEDIDQATYNPYSTLGWGRVILTDKCDNPEDYMKWFDFENTDIGTKLLGYGVPNQPDSIWDYDESTKEAKFREDKVAQITSPTPTFDFEPYMQLGGECQMQLTFGSDMLADGTNCWFNQSNKDKWKQLKDERLKDTFFDATAINAVVFPPDESITDTRQRCIDIVSSGWAKAIFAKTEEECEKIYMETRDKANAGGMKDVEEFYTTEYRKNIEKWGN